MMGGVLGGVTPFPFALLSPMTLTSSFTEIPCSSGGMSLLKVINGFLTTGDCCCGGGLSLKDLTDFDISPDLKSFWKNDGFIGDPGVAGRVEPKAEGAENFFNAGGCCGNINPG